VAALGADQPVDILGQHGLQHLQAGPNRRGEQALAGSAGQLGDRDAYLLGELELAMVKDDLVNAGATWVDEPAFRDGNLVWGRVVPDIPAFCRELVAAIEAGQPG
jgi:putative intracellular protease/amidase